MHPFTALEGAKLHSRAHLSLAQAMTSCSSPVAADLDTSLVAFSSPVAADLDTSLVAFSSPVAADLDTKVVLVAFCIMQAIATGLAEAFVRCGIREMRHQDDLLTSMKRVSRVVETRRLPSQAAVLVVLWRQLHAAAQQLLVEDAGVMTPSTPEHNVENISIRSWIKLDLLGRGSFGTVYEGVSEDGVYFALKEVSLSENDSRAQQCVTQLEQEIKFLSRFKHENIVRYYGTQREPDKLYIFLELATKGSLCSLYEKHTLFDSQIRSYTRQILSGLKYLHEQNIIHRDIKCANILADANGKIKVADFGIAKQISQLDELNSCKGTVSWMAPEVIDLRKKYSFPADIWSLGCTVLEMATGRPPFGDMEWFRVAWKLGRGEAPPIPETLTEEAKDFIKQCLKVNPARRPSASQLLEHPFVQYAGGTGLTPRTLRSF